MSSSSVSAARTRKTVPPMTTPSDEELLHRIAVQQDREAFQALFDRLGPKTFSLALYLCGNRAKAEEAVQDAMLSVWLKAGRFDPERGTAKAWILRIAANKATQAVFRERSERNREMTLRKDAAREEESAPELRLEKEALVGAVREKFAELPKAFRQVLALYFAAEMTQQEISRTLNIPQATISLRIHQGLDDLRRRLEGAGYAAALPMVASNGFGNLLLSGSEVPAGLAATVLKRLSIVAEHSARTATAKSASGLWIAIGLVAAVAATVGWKAKRGNIAAGQQTHVQDAPTVRARNPDGAAPVPGRGHPENWSCTFRDGVPKDLVLLEGRWSLRQHPMKKVNVLTTDSDDDSPSMLALPAYAGNAPFILEINYIIEEGVEFQTSLVLTDGKSILQGVGQSRSTINVDSLQRWGSMTVRYYCANGNIVGASSGELIDGECLLSFSRFSNEWTGKDRLVIVSSRIKIESIRFSKVRLEEFPAEYRDFDRIATQLLLAGAEPKVIGNGRTPLLERHKHLLAQFEHGKE